jgi:hypothetical protein
MDQSIFTSSVTFDPSVDAVDAESLTVGASDYATELEVVAPTVTEKINQVQQPGESWMDTLQRMLPTLATTYQQHQLLQVQVDRAKAGLPPLDVSQYAAGVQVGLSPETRKLLMGAGFVGLAILMLIHFGGGGGGRGHA